MNLRSGNCDAQVLVAVHDAQFFERFGHSLLKTWETKSLGQVDTLNRESLKELMVKPNWASQSLVALVEGLQRLKVLEPAKVSLPDVEYLF